MPLDLYFQLPRLLGFPGGSAAEESTCKVGDLGWIPGLGRSPGEGKGYPLQYSGLVHLSCAGRHSPWVYKHLHG